jgi:hypothetical protein
MYAKLNEGAIAVYPYPLSQLRADNPYTSFPQSPTAEELAPFNAVIVEPVTAPVVPYTETVTEGTPELEAGVWKQTWVVTEATTQEIADREAVMRAAVSGQAKALLVESDWSEQPSVRNTAFTPHLSNGSAFDTYRLALRTIVINAPISVESWPVRPDAVWVEE